MKQKRMLKTLLVALAFTVFFTGCSKDDKAVDKEYPTVDVGTAQAFPKQCSALKRDSKVMAKIFVADNEELGSVSIDIHHNFDHHTHSTEVGDCSLEDKKTPIKPLVFIKSIPIPAGNKTYTVTQEIEIPSDIDPGDYHFMIKATDKEGWQTIKGLSIKIK